MDPWRKSISLITWGFLFTSFTLNFLLLQYILPTIGVLLLYLGFRSLRTVNRCFFFTWILVMIKLIGQVIQLMLYATPFITFYQNNVVIKVITVILQIAILIIFRKGIHIFYSQAGIKATRDPILWAIIWTGLIAVCALFPIETIWIIALPFIIILLMIIHSLYKVGDDVREADYEFVNAPVKIRNELVILGYCTSCIIVITICCIFANHLNIKESVQVVMTKSETRAQLIQLGFPKNVIQDVSDKDVSMLSGAVRIDSSSDSLMFNSVEVTTRTGTNTYKSSNQSGNCDLQTTTIYIEFQNNLIYVIEYFDWMKSKAYWQDGFSISGNNEYELLNGVLLFKKSGTEYTAPIPRLKCETARSYSIFGADESRKISGAVSYPFDSENQRGYIFYRLQMPKEVVAGGNSMDYIHFSNPLQFPYVESEKRLLNGSYILGKNMKQHYTYFETHAYPDGLK